MPGDQWWENSARKGEGRHHAPDLLRHGSHRAVASAGGVVDVHVHEPPLGRGPVVLALEQSDAVDHRGGADPFHDQAHVDGGGEADLPEVAAGGLGDHPDGRELPDVEPGGLQEVGVDRRVEQLVVARVVHVAVDVVVGPPAGRPPPLHVVRARGPGSALVHAPAVSRSRWLITAETPSLRMLTPYSASPTSMVRFWWVMTRSWLFSRSS